MVSGTSRKSGSSGAEPAVADHQAFAVRGELARDGFHTVRAPAGYDGDSLRAIAFLEHRIEIAHDVLENRRHVVERAIGENHRVFEQAVGIDLGEEGRHVGIPLAGKMVFILMNVSSQNMTGRAAVGKG